MKKICIIQGNPARKRDSFCASLADAYASAAKDAGAEVMTFHLKDLTFDLVLHEGYAEDQDLEHDLVQLRSAMVAADHIVMVFPLWHGMPPALFKGFIDRTITRGFAFNYHHGFPIATNVFCGKTAEIIITCSMPAFLYRWFSGAHASAALKTILKMCGIRVIGVRVFGLMSLSGAKAEKRFLSYIKKTRAFGEQASK